MPTVEQAREWYPADDPVHGFDHVLRVMRSAEEIGEELGQMSRTGEKHHKYRGHEVDDAIGIARARLLIVRQILVSRVCAEADGG